MSLEIEQTPSFLLGLVDFHNSFDKNLKEKSHSLFLKMITDHYFKSVLLTAFTLCYDNLDRRVCVCLFLFMFVCFHSCLCYCLFMFVFVYSLMFVMFVFVYVCVFFFRACVCVYSIIHVCFILFIHVCFFRKEDWVIYLFK